MARVTVEDCLKNVKNRFELVDIAAKRARQLMHGKEPKVAWDNDKATVVALREIAAGYTDFDALDREEIERAIQQRKEEQKPLQVEENSDDDILDEETPESSEADTGSEPASSTVAPTDRSEE